MNSFGDAAVIHKPLERPAPSQFMTSAKASQWNKGCVHSGAIHCSRCNLYQISKVPNPCSEAWLLNSSGHTRVLFGVWGFCFSWLQARGRARAPLPPKNLITSAFELRVFFKCHDLLYPPRSHNSQPRQIQPGQPGSPRAGSCHEKWRAIFFFIRNYKHLGFFSRLQKFW